ncbi:hypothetical protein QWJ41_15020 [Nocardioides sp. SOB44]|uniref:Uncharacterized protein n=1 Tax=Nocardioides cremeus TaxID=3058044 RepID=A0ABT8TXC7_9ACTN|nr:hypothetical protein [Nocardioides cremeus]MDO3397037.1 hypothetical protein [Nocardioides cremeus]
MTLALLGTWLAAVGAGDLVRAAYDVVSPRRAAVCIGAGLGVLLAGLLLLDLDAARLVLLLVLLGSLQAVWLLGSVLAVGPDRTGPWRDRARSLALLALGGGTVAAVLGAALLTTEPTLPTRLAGTVLGRWPLSDVLVASGVVLAQLATANVVVRLVLDAVGVPATSNEKQLKGGRVLGPMERLFIVGLGAVGELTAAAVVIAAKGLLRFPELQRAQQRLPPAGPSDVTEYFLVGSFASWLVALGGAALIHLA